MQGNVARAFQGSLDEILDIQHLPGIVGRDLQRVHAARAIADVADGRIGIFRSAVERGRELPHGGKCADVNLEGLRRRVGWEQQFETVWLAVYPDAGRGMGHARGRGAVAPTITVEVVGVRKGAGESLGNKVGDLGRHAGFSVKATIGVETPMHPVKRPFRGQVHLRALWYGSKGH